MAAVTLCKLLRCPGWCFPCVGVFLVVGWVFYRCVVWLRVFVVFL